MKQYLSLIIIVFLFAGCESQIGTAIGTAIGNVVTGKAFGDSASDEAFEQYRKKTNKAEASLNTVSSSADCGADPLASLTIELKSSIDMSKIKDNLCTCKTWGTCDASSCACGILCPDNFNILNRTGLALNETDENSLAFTNGDSDFYAKDKNYAGYCWGHAVVTQRFNRLAKFDDSSPKLYADENQDSERLAHYKDIIKRLNNNEPVDIPGYKNLKEFSRNPEIKTLLEESVKDNWAANAMTSQGLGIIKDSEPQGADYYNKLFDDIKFRLGNFQSPTIVFNQSGNAMMSHAVLVSGIGVEENGERYLCLRDNNYSASMTENCRQKLRLRSNGTCYYDGWYSSVGKIVLSQSENGNTVEQMKNLRSSCLGEKKCSSAN